MPTIWGIAVGTATVPAAVAVSDKDLLIYLLPYCKSHIILGKQNLKKYTPFVKVTVSKIVVFMCRTGGQDVEKQ